MSKQKTKKKTGTAANPTSESAKANTVNGKRALYQSAANEMLQSGIRDLQAGVHEMQIGIKEQINENKVDLFAFQAGVHEMQLKYKAGAAALQSGVAEMMSSIAEQIKANQEYTKQFYG